MTTTDSIWAHLISNDDDDPIELKTEKEADSEENEKELEDLFHGGFNSPVCIVPQVPCSLQKVGSNSYVFSNHTTEKLYLKLHRLKVDF